MGDSLEISGNNVVNGGALNTDKQCLNNGDVDECVSSGNLLVIKKMDGSDGRNGTDTGENDEPVPLPITASPLVDDEHEDYLDMEIKNCVENDAKSEPSHSVSDKCQPNIVSDSGHEDSEASELCLDEAGHPDCVVATSNGCADIQNPAADAGNIESQSKVQDDSNSLKKANEHCLDEANHPDCVVATSSSCADVQNPAADAGNIESQSTVQDDSNSLQKPASCATSYTETLNSDFRNSQAEDLPTGQFDENHDAVDNGNESCVAVDPQLQLECEDDEVKESEKPADGLTCEAADESSENSSLLSTTDVSAANVTSSATSLYTVSTVEISTPLSSSLNVSKMPTRVAVLSSTSSAHVTRPTQPLTVSVPSATASSSSNTRPMSKVLQDVGLLLVSQRVFKNLASIQKHKIGGSRKQCDMDLLRKLKASHQNLVAKNHGLLTAERKCWCGFRSESMNVIEEHRLMCDFQGRCCYCNGQFVYRTPKLMKRHLWKFHRKVGYITDRSGSFMCFFCPQNFPSRMWLMRHLDVCRRKFSLSSNLAPKDTDKDIPVMVASKQPVQIPIKVSSTQISTAAAMRNSSGNTSSPSVTLMSPATVPTAVNLQFAPAPRNPGSVTKLLQIGKQLYTLLPSTTVAGAAMAVNASSAIKSVGKMALNSAIQTAQNANSALPISVSNRSASHTHTASKTITVPPSILQRSIQYTVCSVCNAFVRDKTQLLVHMHVAHSATHKVCQYCCNPDVTFPSLTELHRHVAKFHTSDCWICRMRFQPPEQLINHISDRHKVTASKMLELRRCYLCSSVPSFPTYTAFEEHMLKLHSLQFPDAGKLWDHIVNSPNADRNWYAKKNPDGTLECPICLGQFISTTFLYRHLHLEHNGKVIRMVHCRECWKRMPSSILRIHLTAAHTRKCSVKLSRVDVSDYGCVFVPPVGTKRKRNKKGEPVFGYPKVKRVKAAETVVISDDDGSDNDGECQDDSGAEDFVSTAQISVQSAHRPRRSIRTRTDRRNSSADDVREVLESIVDSGDSETVVKRSVGFVNTSICPAPVGPAAAAQLSNGITEDEVEIIESIVPTIRDRHQQPVSKPEPYKPSDRDCTLTSTASAESANSSEAADAASVGSDVKSAEYHNGDCQQPSTKPKSALAESSAQHLMARDQIMMNSVEEVLEIDGETVLIVHDDDNGDEDD